MTQQNKSERTRTSFEQSQNLKLGRDPVTGYATIKLANISLVLKKGTKVSEVLNKPLREIKECEIR